MLPRSERLSRSDFELLRGRGARMHGVFCTVSYVQAPTLGVGVVVSKKVARGAVDRNLLRRRVYAIIRDLKKDLKMAYIVVFLKKEASGASYRALQEEIQDLFSKAKLL